MIALEVKDYCQNCAEFDPETTVSERSYCGMTGMNILTDTTVTCRNVIDYMNLSKRKTIKKFKVTY